ncbi:MAG: NifU family protein [Betaproteobacteria bacterium]|nr:NifU family protein [Betaproteobacteria bacterium]
MPERSAPPNPPFYTDEELDALYEKDPVEAMRISRRQAQWLKALEEASPADGDAPPPTREQVAEVLEQARRVLLQDGGDLELVAIDGDTLRIRLKGNCVGCPRATLDLKNVVERTVRRHFPQIRKIENTF